MKINRTLASLVLGATIMSVTATTANAAPMATAQAAPQLVAAVQTPEEVAMERFAVALERMQREMPKALQEMSPREPAVQAWITQNMGKDNWLTCTLAIAEFAFNIGFPVGRIWALIKEVGGVKKFFGIIYQFATSGRIPPEASKEFLDFLEKATGIGGLLSSCP